MTHILDVSPDKNTLLFLMSNISPKVRDSLETENYRSTAEPDGATLEYILEVAFKNLIQDLETIGLSFDIDMSDYVDDSNKLSKFIQLVQLLLPNTLYDIIKTDTAVRDLLSQIVGGSLGHEGTTIQVYLSEIAGLDGGIPVRETLVDFIDQIYPLVSQTSVFSDYIKNLLDLHSDERPSVITDPERHLEYSEFLKNLVGDFGDALHLFEGHKGFDKVLTIQNFIIRDLISPHNFTDYAYMFLEYKINLPEELREGLDRKWYHYAVSHPWFYEYYTLRNILAEFSEEYQIAYVCFRYALSAGLRENFELSIEEAKSKIPGLSDKINIVNSLWFKDQ
jgi:hypothetical protein